jgi:3'-phosphoadenosine 5'-phosphosulfate sulfotransferase (PAPS reductase)/FAD synthetase
MERIERDAFLAHATLPTFKRKVEKAKEIIREALAIAPAYVAVSWGKDSVVMLHLVQSICPDILAVHSGCEHQYDQDSYADAEINYLKHNQTNYVREISDGSSLWEEKYYSTNPLVFLGLRKEENLKRRLSILKHGDIHQYTSGKRTDCYRCCPIASFTWQDIWAYTAKYNLPYLQSYENDWQSRTSVFHDLEDKNLTHNAGFRQGGIEKMYRYQRNKR